MPNLPNCKLTVLTFWKTGGKNPCKSHTCNSDFRQHHDRHFVRTESINKLPFH